MTDLMTEAMEQTADWPVKYAWCGYWNGICKAVYADIPDQQDFTEAEIVQWIRQGADMLRRAPIDIAKKELKL